MKSKAIAVMALLTFAFGDAEAVPVSRFQATAAAQAWVKDGRRLGVRIGRDVETTSVLTTAGGARLYAVKMCDGGTVLMSGDTDCEPVVGFTSEPVDLSAIDEGSPLKALLEADAAFRRRAAELKASQASSASARTSSYATATVAGPDKTTATGRRWAALLPVAADDGGRDAANPIANVSNLEDVRVDCLLTTKWGQSNMSIQGGGRATCFNLDTPNHSVCGCVATAFAQTMRYHCWPVDNVPVFSEECTYNSQKKTLWTKGGVFDWANMPETALSANSATRTTQCEAIGRLTYECGVSVRMQYSDGSSGAYTQDVIAALKNRFGYTNAVWCSQSSKLTSDEEFRQNIVYPSLDAGYPVIFSIRGGMGGHAVVCDGYGYDVFDGESIPYVHLNMGWTGSNDWWYNLPNIDVDSNPESFNGFDVVSGVGYDIFPTNTGHIVSGRVLDFDGNPVAGAIIEVDGQQQVVTSSHGVFGCIVKKSAGSSIELSAASADGRYKGDLMVDYTGDDLWGNEITISSPAVEVKVDGEAEGQVFTTLDRALDYAADLVNPTIRILLETELRRSVTITNTCTIFATNPVASASAVRIASGAKLTIEAGNTGVLFTNVVFRHNDALTVDVRADGVVRVSSDVDIGRIRLAEKENFRLAGPLSAPITIDAPFAKESGDVFGRFYQYTAEAAATANLLLDAYDDESGGESYYDASQDRYQLRWKSGAEVPLAAASVRIKSGDTFINYRSFGALFKHHTTGGEIVVVRDSPLTNCLSAIDYPLFLSGATPGLEVRPTTFARFDVLDGGSLVISNLTIRGYSGPRLFSVRGGAMTLEYGAELRELEKREWQKSELDELKKIIGSSQTPWENDTPGSGVTVLESGMFTMMPGSRIVDCRAMYDNVDDCKGGGICAWAGTLDLCGGEIIGCMAFKSGGGVYAWTSWGDLDVWLSGDLRVEGNKAGENMDVDNVTIYGADRYDLNVVHYAKVAAPFTAAATVGISYEGLGNWSGDLFATLDDSLDAAAQTQAADVFRNDKYPTLRAEVVESGGSPYLAWMQMDEEDGQVAPDKARALVVYGDGTAAPVTNYYGHVNTAFAYMTNAATVVVLTNQFLVYDAALEYETLLTSLPEVSLDRSADYDVGFTVGAGKSLTISNLTFNGRFNAVVDPDTEPLMFKEPLFSVEGGRLTFGGGTTISNSCGKSTYSAAAVLVTKGGVFTMEEGALIANCINLYDGETEGVLKDADAGLAGGVIVNGGRANFRGGEIRDCIACKGGAIFVCNDSIARVSGSFRVTSNNYRFKDGGLADIAYDGDGLICLDGLYDGAAGVNCGWSLKEGFITANSNVFGIVEYDGALSDLAASAAKFQRKFRPDDFAYGMIATTNGVDGLLVWSTAVVSDESSSDVQTFTDDNGNVYQVIPVAVPTVAPSDPSNPSNPSNPTNPTDPLDPSVPAGVVNTPGPLAFKEISRVSDLEWRLVITNRTAKCEYALAYIDLSSGTVTTGAWERAETDGAWTTNVIFSSENVPRAFFWKALGRKTYDEVVAP